MYKKITAVLLFACLLNINIAIVLPTPIHAYGGVSYEDIGEYKSKLRILYGLLLIVGGGALAYDGFRTVKVDISKPAIDFNYGIPNGRWQNTPGQVGWVTLESRGTIQNIGNVTLRNIGFEVRYRSTGYQSGFYYPAPDYRGNPDGVPVVFTDMQYGLNSSVVGQTNEWTNTITYLKSVAAFNDPLGEQNYWYPDTNPDIELVEIVNIKYTWDKKYKEEMNNVYEGIAGALILGAGVYLIVDYIISLKKFDYYMKKHGMDIYVENYYDEFRLKMSKRI
ncbi:MAG: hypothetical protein FWF00_00030 [Endomicrobia bacterium]|nr:hypothetical protein [Endomicrobiia bacterium]MCL2506065.1 hypothetical protein [Endomicrobiia bacterium]